MPNAPGIALVLAAQTLAQQASPTPIPTPPPERPTAALKPPRPGLLETDVRTAAILLETLEARFEDRSPLTANEYDTVEWLSRVAAHSGVRRVATAYLVEAWEYGILEESMEERFQQRINEAVTGSDEAARSSVVAKLARLDLPIDHLPAIEALESMLADRDLLSDQIARTYPELPEHAVEYFADLRSAQMLDALAQLRLRHAADLRD